MEGCNYTVMTVITRRENVDTLKNIFQQCGIQGMNVTEVEGHGQQKAVIRYFDDDREEVKLLPKAEIEVIFAGIDEDMLIEKVCSVCRSGIMGDGKIFIEHKFGRVVKIRNGEEGVAVL